MSGILNALGYGLAQPSDEIAIVVGNTRVVGWETVSITRSVEAFPNNFVLTASDQYPDDPTKATVFPTGPGEKCQVYVGADLVITGFIDRYGITIGGGRHEVTITGRGLCQDLVDCSAVIASNTISASNALDLAQKLSAPFGVTARIADGVDLGKPVKFFTVALGETAYEIVERVARYAGYLVYEDQNGVLVLDRVGTTAMASGFTAPGNIEGASSTLSIDQRFSEYTVVWNTISQYSEINPLANQRADVKDPTMPRYRPRIIVSEQIDPDSDYGTARANWEYARRIGRSQAISLTCDSWRDTSGALWQPNMLAPVNAPALKITNAQWIIGSVVFRKDQSGTHADLVLMPPDAFDPEPTPLYLWDREIMHATPSGPGAASNGLQGSV